MVKRLVSRDETLALRRAGLTSEQVWAIAVIEMGSDVLGHIQRAWCLPKHRTV